MKIAQIAPVNQRVPPRRYGGTERVVYYLTEELVKQGHKVTLFAAAGSETSATLIPVVPHPLRDAHILDASPFTVAEIAKVYKMADKFDIIHNHAWPDYLAFPAAAASKTPTLTTLHNPFTPETKRVFEEYKNLNYVSISKNQRRHCSKLNFCETVYNGIPVANFPFKNNPDDYLLHVGRISLQKGTHVAIDVAAALKKELIIAAKLDPWEVNYFNQYVAPRLSNGHVHWVGEVDEEERNNLMSKALCLLLPVTWNEPFGLVMTEAMACGCPVVAYRKGSIPEIVVHGKTGFVVDNEKQMIRSVKRIGAINRKTCREHVKENFNLERMVSSYEKVYNKIIDKHKAAK
ncbi:MAG TPA: glycosyltransferase family 4 protein [Candidatus Nanoarchaeia archaeon]